MHRFFYAVSLPLLLGGIMYMLRFMPAPDTHWAVKLDVGLAWCAWLQFHDLISSSCGRAARPVI